MFPQSIHALYHSPMTRGVLCGGAAALLLLGALHVHGGLAWVVAAPFALQATPTVRWKDACIAGIVFALVLALVENAPWVTATAERYFALPPGLAIASTLLLAVVCGSVFGALLGAAQFLGLRVSPAFSIVVLAAVWSVWEELLLLIVPRYPWVSLATTQVELPLLVQAASVGGQQGLAFLMVAAGTALGFAVRFRSSARAALRFAAAGMLIVAATAVVGALRFAGRTPSETDCVVAAVDAGFASAPAGWQEAISRFEQRSVSAMQVRPSVVVWPESSLSGYPETDTALRQRLDALVRASRVPLIVGGPRAEWTADWSPRLFNSVYAVEAGVPLRHADKRRLVPFAEYWPFPVGPPAWLSIEEIAPGTHPTVFSVGACQLGVLVCFEADHPSLARDLVDAGAHALLVLSNDAQLPPRAVASEVAQARLRAVETGLPVVRAANHGVSVAIDRWGEVRQWSTADALIAHLTDAVPAPAVRWAPRVSAASWIIVLLAIGTALLRRH
jgi:apolipoprotein N-acyltransferase